MINADNIVQLKGRLTRDAEYINDNKMVQFSVAVDRSGYEKGSDTNAGFFNCKIFLAENDYTASATIKAYRNLMEDGRLLKGAPVQIVGQLNHDRFVDKEGNKRSEVTVIVEALTSYSKSAGGAETNTSAEAPTSQQTSSGSHQEPF